MLSEEEIRHFEDHAMEFLAEGVDNSLFRETLKGVLDLITTIRDRDKLLCIEKQSNRTLALMVDRAKEALEERDKTIAELQWVQSKFEQYYQIASEQSERAFKAEQQNTILCEALERICKVEKCCACDDDLGLAQTIACEALAKVDNV